MKKEKKKIGEVGVDSGQIMICDPCYIKSEWEDEDFVGERRYRHQGTGDILAFPKDFSSYEDKFYAGKNMNEMIRDKEVEKMTPHPAKFNFSYNAVCLKTLSDEGHGQLDYKMGSPGVAVASTTQIGDGMYPVFASYRDGDLIKIEIVFRA